LFAGRIEVASVSIALSVWRQAAARIVHKTRYPECFCDDSEGRSTRAAGIDRISGKTSPFLNFLSCTSGTS